MQDYKKHNGLAKGTSFGPSNLFAVGIPSVLSASNAEQVLGEPRGVRTHDFYWTEMRANQYAAGYFGRNYGVPWSSYETHYPRCRR